MFIKIGQQTYPVTNHDSVQIENPQRKKQQMGYVVAICGFVSFVVVSFML